MEPIVEQIADWINDAIDGQQDPDGTLTLRAVRPEILDWDVSNYKHGDCVIEAVKSETQSKASSSRTEVASWTLHGIVRDLPDNTAADTCLHRIAETIRRLVMAGNSGRRACGGLAQSIDCPTVMHGIIEGGVVAEVTVNAKYMTASYDGYSAAG